LNAPTPASSPSRFARLFPVSLLAVVCLLGIGISQGVLEPPRQKGPPRIIDVQAFQFGFEPSRITVEAGEEVIFRATSIDVTHGFYIDGANVKENLEPFVSKDIGPLVFEKPGKLKIRCAHFCGPLHPFMVADLIVESRSVPYFALLLGLAVLTALAMLVYVWKVSPTDSLLGVPLSWSFDLFTLPWVGPKLKRFFQWDLSRFWLVVPSFWLMVLICTAAAVGNPMGALNFSVAIVWILWFCLVEFLILFGGRLWCMVCPMPLVGEWIARGRVGRDPKAPRRYFSLNWKWPKWLENSWVASLGFLAMSLPIVWLITRPSATGLMFLILATVAVFVPVLFDGGHRRFCDHLCPAFYIGYHSSTSAVAVEPRDEELCRKHQCKECMVGNSRGYGCPWSIYPGGKGRTGTASSIHCSVCTECFKTCSLGNMTMKMRMPGREVVDKVRSRPDEAWQGFIRISLAIFYEFVFFGSQFWMKDWGNMGTFHGSNLQTLGVLVPETGGFLNWLKWCLLVASVSIVIMPAVFFAFSALAHAISGRREKVGVKKLFLSLSYALSPYGQLLWISFGLSLLMVNWAYPVKALASDPLGWGWNYLGIQALSHSAHDLYSPLGAQFLPIVQFCFSMFALALAIQVTFALAYKLFGQDRRAALRTTGVMGTFFLSATGVFMAVFLA
jgi:plastocyanin